MCGCVRPFCRRQHLQCGNPQFIAGVEEKLVSDPLRMEDIDELFSVVAGMDVRCGVPRASFAVQCSLFFAWQRRHDRACRYDACANRHTHDPQH